MLPCLTDANVPCPLLYKQLAALHPPYFAHGICRNASIVVSTPHPTPACEALDCESVAPHAASRPDVRRKIFWSGNNRGHVSWSCLIHVLSPNREGQSADDQATVSLLESFDVAKGYQWGIFSMWQLQLAYKKVFIGWLTSKYLFGRPSVLMWHRNKSEEKSQTKNIFFNEFLRKWFFLGNRSSNGLVWVFLNILCNRPNCNFVFLFPLMSCYAWLWENKVLWLDLTLEVLLMSTNNMFLWRN